MIFKALPGLVIATEALLVVYHANAYYIHRLVGAEFMI